MGLRGTNRPSTSDADDALASPVLEQTMFVRFASYGAAVDTTAGEVLYDPASAHSELLLIESGQASLWSTSIDGEHRQRIALRGPGEFIGELGLLTGQRPFVSAVMDAPGRVHRIDGAGLRRLMSNESELSDVILRAFLARRRRLSEGAAASSVEIIGEVDAAETLALRIYAARQRIAHIWVDSDSPAGRSELSSRGLTRDDLPLVLTSQGALRAATPAAMGARLGLTLRSDLQGCVDLAVIGGGPAGLAATIYGASEGLVTTLVDAVNIGGQAAASSRIENYLGFPSGVSGADLAAGAAVQALKFGADLASPCRVVGIGRERDHSYYTLVLDDGTTLDARAVIVASGVSYRALPLARWPDFEGAGIFYAATSIEARGCADRDVVVIGGANSAGQAALFLSSRGACVSLVVRAAELEAGMSSYLVQRIVADQQITVLTSSEVVALHGAEHLASVRVRTPDGERDIEVAAVFCFIGARPATSWLSGAALDEDGFVLTDRDLTRELLANPDWQVMEREPLPFETSYPAVFAVGDVRHGSMKRVAAAVGEGAAAVQSVHRALAMLTRRARPL